MHPRQSSSIRLAFFLSVIACSAVACHRPRVDPLPGTAQPFTAPPVFARWWAMTAECSGASTAMTDVKWFVVPGVSLFWRAGSVINGYWSREDNAIVLAQGAIDDGAVVRHEMLHAMQREGRHLRRDFVEHCGGVVSCLSVCLEAAGEGPVPNAALAVVPSDLMPVEVTIDPAVSEGPVDGRFTVTVSVRNPRADSVVVPLPGSSPGSAPGFRFELTNGTFGVANGIAWRGSAPMVFGPGETRRAVFDIRVADGANASLQSLTPGLYEIRGGFGLAWSSTRSFTLSQ